MPMKYPAHPGRIIRSDMEALGMGVEETAPKIGVTPDQLLSLINGETIVTSETAVRLGELFGGGAEIWRRLQAQYDEAQERNSEGGLAMTQTDDSQNVYDRDTEFRHEEHHLDAVVGSIDEGIQYRESRGPISAVDSRSADRATDIRNLGLGELRSARNRPYFGRVDYSTGTGGDVKTIYIGEFNVQHEDPRYFIASRNAPIARLYYRPADGFYDPPARRVYVSLQMKRMLTIEEAHLLDFDDVLRLPPGSAVPPTGSSRILDQRLSDVASGQLSDAVQTIQPEQYEQMTATQNPVLIVQGAAGSGKSLTGLHRIDFILSPHSDIGRLGSRPTAERVIMFGPSPAFLKYVSDLLPGLGVHGVRQTTVSQWLLSQFSSRVTLSRGDRIFEDLMNNRRKLTEAEIEAHSFKAGLKMKRLVDNYVARMRRDIRASVDRSTEISIPGNPPVELSTASLKRRVSDAFKRHKEPNAARAYLLNSLAEEWERLNPRRGATRSEAIAEARKLVEGKLDFWPRKDFRTEYTNLVSSRDKIMEHSRKGDIDLPGANEIARTAPSGAGWALGITDLAAALYFDYAINGFESERFEHVVVDEAQDVSPLEIVLMRMHSANDTFTIFGDLRQSVLPYKSINNWNHLAVLFERESVSRLDSRVDRRSTRQITQYSNRILQGLPERTKMPIAYDRSGERPQLVRSKSAAEMRKAIADSVRRLTNLSDIRSVAVLTKWRETAEKISETLRGEGIESVGLLTQDELIETDVIVSPIVLTKGLEFDAVIVANAHKDNFNESDFDRLLLYLACTRAKHRLEIHWHGTRSPIVPGVTRLPR